MKKKILIILLILFIIPFLWILIEYYRFETLGYEYDRPLILLDETFCSKDSIACYNENGDYIHTYHGIGFSVRLTYHLDDNDSHFYEKKKPNYSLTKRNFYLFKYNF